MPKEKQQNKHFLIQFNEALELFHWEEYAQSFVIFNYFALL